jgi:hypothetical protein
MKEIILAAEIYLLLIIISMVVAFLIKGMLSFIRLFSKKPTVNVQESVNKGK